MTSDGAASATAQRTARVSEVDIDQRPDSTDHLADDIERCLEQLDRLYFPELRPRSPWKRSKEAIRRRRSGSKVAPATEVITLGPALTRLFVSEGETHLLDEIASWNRAIMQQYT
ncbi:hypothetical protein E2562_009026 [Oryza meyeriana var. granulata]|uniref:Uncharacterized protein n=1 Tax=Oryza meyeriana var. granulata TaxID=110450 RepID=A0A6G1D0T7_9ORYZ|nr:hypothetical protein E2562_009026 [Oryza meyeriana var. granulata]